MQTPDLLSHLEEPKLLMLFRHLIDADARASTDLPRAVPLDLPDVEIHAKLSLRRFSTRRSGTGLWFFQLSHVPACLWDPESATRMMHTRMRQAFQCLKARPHLLKVLRLESPPPDELFSGSEEVYFPEPVCSDYYYFTNYCHGLSDEAMEAFSRQSQQLFSDTLGPMSEQRLRFGIATPETLNHSARSEVNRFLVDLLNTPSSYYFIAREGRIEVAAVTEHGAFLVAPGIRRMDAEGRQVCAIATSTLREHAPAGLSDLSTLLNHSKTTEHDLQSFFESYPHFLLSLDGRYCDVRPHVCLFDTAGNQFVPDFMVRIEGSDLWDLIELKRPQHLGSTRSSGTARAAQVAARGIAELLQYASALASSGSRSRLRSACGMAPYDPGLVLVIGRGYPDHSREWIAARAGYPRVRIVSYDYLFERAQMCRKYLRSR